MPMQNRTVSVVGGGLAGSEAALWLVGRGLKVRLYEQKPLCFSPAHKSPGFAELICSNSFKAERPESAAGILKAEMRAMGSALLAAADKTRVPAGGALSVDRERFSLEVTRMLEENANIDIVRERVNALPEGVVIVASGPLTDGALAEEIRALCGGMLSFYDAAAPIVTAESIDMDEVFAASRYDRGEADYLNCPFDKAGYEGFYNELVRAETAELHNVDSSPEDSGKIKVYEGCIAVEILAKRGPDTLRFGPLKPVGLKNPKTGHRPWANVQLRKENREGTLYNLVGFQTNLRFGEQKRVFSLIPGLANAEFARYGVMHRNTFINSPQALAANLAAKTRRDVFFAGQITGFEGYMESAACGLLAARAACDFLQGKAFTPPGDTMCGALLGYIGKENVDFQPMGANLGILPPLPLHIRDKRLRAQAYYERAMAQIEEWNKMY